MTTLTRVNLRELTAADVARVVGLTRSTGVFRDEEIAIAEEVVGEAVKGIRADRANGADETDGGERPYYALGAEVDGRVVGWICWGATPCTVATWDLYWMAVDPAHHGAGIGSALLHAMEQRLAGAARLVVVETAGRPDYAPTRAFYEARGYRAVSRIPDFYAPGDDQVVYVKSLSDG